MVASTGMTARKVGLSSRLPQRRIAQKCLRSAGDGEQVEFGVVEEEKGVQRQQMFQALVELQGETENTCAADGTLVDATPTLRESSRQLPAE